MALAATGSPPVAEEVSFASGKELKLAGINWAYSPVADVNSDPRNPVIGRCHSPSRSRIYPHHPQVFDHSATVGLSPSARHTTQTCSKIPSK
jgi:beta-N-acetylhexosaminidase